ncbi:MAG: SapC family protein [Terricaulis sp.]
MARNVLINNVDHAKLRVITKRAAAYGDGANPVPIFPTEFTEAQREYPILFRKGASGAYQAVVLLGLQKDENLFLNEPGWRGRYLPAMLARGPFMIGMTPRPGEDGSVQREPMIMVDLDDPRVSETEGEPLFLEHGGNSRYLERIAFTLRMLRVGIELAKPMFALFEELDLITPVKLDIAFTDTQSYNLDSFYTVDAERLANLDGASLERLNRAGFLGAAVMVIASLNNVNRLAEMKIQQLGKS